MLAYVPGIAQPDWAPDTPIPARKTFISTGLDGQPRPSFFTLTRHQSFGFTVDAEQTAETQGIDNNSGWEVGLNFPLVLQPGFKLFGSLRYAEEDFELEHPRTEVWPESIHNKPFRQYSASLLATKVFPESPWFIVNRLQASLAGDVRWNTPGDFLQYSWATIVGWKKNTRTVWGLGGIYGTDLNGTSLLPVVLFQQRLTTRWTLDALLPARINAQYFSANEKNVLYGSVSLEGPDYRVDLPTPLTQPSEVIFERSDIQLSLRAEREVHDWLWLATEAGHRFPVNTSWERPELGFTTSDLTLDSYWFMSLSLFLVPPRQLYNRTLAP